MGQRSQIYVKFESDDRKLLIARYYQWNYGERMISRARYAIDYIKSTFDSFYKDQPEDFHWHYENDEFIRKFKRILDTNFDMHNVVLSTDIIQEYNDRFSDCNFNDFTFSDQDNNDGQFYLYIQKDGTMKYAFTDSDMIDRLSSYEYFARYKDDYYNNDDDKELLDTCETNMKYITENAQLMTNGEWADFINDDYSSLIKRSTEIQVNVFRLTVLWGNAASGNDSYKGIKYSDLLNGYSYEEAAWMIRNWVRYFNQYWTDDKSIVNDISKYFEYKLTQLIDKKLDID